MEVKPGYKQTEVGVIPTEWEIRRLGDLADLLSSKRIFESDYVSMGVPFYRGTEVTLLIKSQPIPDDYFISSERYLRIQQKYGAPRKGDILITAVGTLGNVYYIPDDKPFYFKDGNLIWLRQINAVDGRFLALQLANLKRQIVSSAIGSTQKALTIVTLNGTLLPLPPTLAEQRAIAEALSDADALIESLEQLLAKKRQVKQGAMQELLTGRRRLPGFEGEWEVKRFEDVTLIRRDRIDPRRTGVHEFCIELENIESDTGALLGSTSTGKQSSLKTVFRTGDILFGKLRAYLRKYWLATRPGVCSTEIWVFVSNERRITTDYLFQLIRTDQFIDAASNAYGTHMPRSDWNVVKNHEFPLPELLEQTGIAAILSDMDAEITALEAKLDKTRQIKQGMMQELLTGRIRLV